MALDTGRLFLSRLSLLRRILAMADGDNRTSTRLLDRLGFTCDGMVTMQGETTPIRQYVLDPA